MRLLCNGQILEIEDIYASYSPFLNALLHSGVGADKEDDAYVIDGDKDHFIEYLAFLQGKPFKMDSNIATLFDYMGHHNTMEYPFDYWIIKLRDNWIRDNMYKLSLYDSPLYGLREIPLKNRVDCEYVEHLSDDCYIAGGACLYMAGLSDHYSDIDIFFTDKDKAKEYMLALRKREVDRLRVEHEQLKAKHMQRQQHIEGIIYDYDFSDEYIVHKGEHTISFAYDGAKKVQMILRMYKAPTEIVHGFDLDCVGIIYVAGKLWATERTLYALANHCNWLDPLRASPSYVYRLSKYNMRGYKIMLPLFVNANINKKCINGFISQIHALFDRYVHIEDDNDEDEHSDIDNYMITNPVNFILDIIQNINNERQVSVEDLSIEIQTAIYLKATEKRNSETLFRKLLHKGKVLDKIHIGSIIRTLVCFPDKNAGHELRSIMPTDSVSMLIMAKYLGIHSHLWKCSDYKSKEGGAKNVMDIEKAIECIVWKEQNPMEQVTSTFQPEPIGDIEQWYMKSLFYQHIIIKDNKEYDEQYDLAILLQSYKSSLSKPIVQFKSLHLVEHGGTFHIQKPVANPVINSNPVVSQFLQLIGRTGRTNTSSELDASDEGDYLYDSDQE